MSNKGRTLVFCKKCRKKKFVTKVSMPGHNYKFTCNKGHQWIIEGVTGERVTAILEQVLDNIEDFFDRDDAFYRSLSRK